MDNELEMMKYKMTDVSADGPRYDHIWYNFACNGTYEPSAENTKKHKLMECQRCKKVSQRQNFYPEPHNLKRCSEHYYHLKKRGNHG